MSMAKIMVADDDKNICELLRLYLEKEGYTVTLAHDGETAVEQFSAEAFGAAAARLYASVEEDAMPAAVGARW